MKTIYDQTKLKGNKVFEPFELAGITFPNRIIRSATYEGMGDENGKPTDQLLKKYEALAKGGVGGIITGFIGVSQQGRSSGFHMSMLDKAENVEAYKKLTKRMHEMGTPIIAQLNHCGGQTKEESTHMPVVAPSKISDYKAKEITKAEILEVIEAFVQGIKNAKEAGFDGVQIHVAHGYLLSEFVSPRMNRRKDEWGGSTENRFRIVKLIFEKARKEVGDYPILVKLNGYETLKNGMTIEESIKIAKLLEQVGCDGIEVSNGTEKAGLATIRGQVPWKILIAQNKKLNKMPEFMKNFVGIVVKKTLPQPQPKNLFNLEAAMSIKKAVNIPVILVGGITKLEEIEDVIKDKIDAVSMCRPFIIESDLVNKFKTGKQTQSKCIQCNFCIIGTLRGPFRCYYGKLPVSKS
ncbi:NADH:flavin oxidoreductase [Desulfosporosinus nitroreducens]|uniref:NADH:flavin oxidoreductase n=1 Tax=Desulfosporosinus nitroreducens TaxID=2018668 RepID=UPI00207C6328|nr:NADH:flavin oxidoreductase [Desulfosporosinus nitroreducens]MCO1604282.1 NADH:flavin oxidoreductase [Desulfosporosinus nitroreducens]